MATQSQTVESRPPGTTVKEMSPGRGKVKGKREGKEYRTMVKFKNLINEEEKESTGAGKKEIHFSFFML